jgi:hypothetical protein
MTMKKRTIKPCYAILTHIIDDDVDYGVELVENINRSALNYNTIKEARKAMNDECRDLLVVYGVDSKVCKKEQNSIYVEIPVTLFGNRTYYVLAKWQIVKL